VLGLLRAESFLGGRMPLDAAAARAAVGHLADSLGLSLEETAAGIVSVNNLRAATLIRQQTLERGLDPRDFVAYAYGGAGPVHAFGYTAEIGIGEVWIPLGNGASTLSAFGIAAGQLTRFVESETSLRAPFDDAALARELAAAIERARQAMIAVGATEEPEIEAWALMRYAEQLMHSLEVPLDSGPATGRAQRLASQFTGEYARRYGESAASAFQAAEIFALRIRARIRSSAGDLSDQVLAHPEAAIGEGTGAAAAAPIATSPVYWPDAAQRLDTAVYDGSQLGAGASVAGPALVELAHTTIAVPRGAALTAAGGHFRLQLPAPAAANGDLR
jgi:N-methylhydantoinase A